MFSSTLLAVVLAVSPVAFGKLFTTSPVASTTFPAGQPATVNWQDDGSAPNLQAFGPSDIGLFTGSVNQQVLLQSIATAVDVSKQNTIQWTPNANVGPDGSKYFIRFTSNGLKDPAQPNFNFPAEAFSAMFTMSGMTGEFNATIQSMIAGSAAPGAATPGSPASSPSAAPSSAAPSSAASKSNAVTSANATASASPQANSKNENGAGRTASGLLGVVGVAFVLSSVLL